MKKLLTINDIRAIKPCYDPTEFLPESWTGTALDILALEQVPAKDRIWVVASLPQVSDKAKRLFAVACARDALARVKDPDPRSIKAVDVAEAYALGKATKNELPAAESAARSATWSATWAAAESAARSAESATRSATWSAAWSAAESAARSAEPTAESAAWAATESTAEFAESAARSAWSTASYAAYLSYVEIFKKLLVELEEI